MVRAGSLLLLALAAPQPATVLSVGDGDTLRLRQGGGTLTVRLACIDAPEMSQAPWGHQARRQLQTLAPIGSAVTLRSKATDRYGRQVAELSRKGRNLNQALVASGAAFVYWPYIRGCDRQTYSRLETDGPAPAAGGVEHAGRHHQAVGRSPFTPHWFRPRCQHPCHHPWGSALPLQRDRLPRPGLGAAAAKTQ